MRLWNRLSRTATGRFVSRRVEPSPLPLEGSLTEQFKLLPMSDICPSTGCAVRRPRHSVCAGTAGSRRPQWYVHGGGEYYGDDEIGFRCECGVVVWLAGEGDVLSLSRREWEAAVVDFAECLGHDRDDRRVRHEARELAKCVGVLRPSCWSRVTSVLGRRN